MKQIIDNKYNLKDTDITEIVKRVKVLIINSKNELLLGYSHNVYMFLGGHVEDNETLVQTINRELEEEAGLLLEVDDIKPFACLNGYYKDWPEEGKNRKTEIYYYEVKTDELPNLEMTLYTENEKAGNFELRYIPLKEIEKVLDENASNYENAKGIANEMKQILNIYKEYINE